MLYAPLLNIARDIPYRNAEFAILADSREKNINPLLPNINIRQIECGDFQVWRKYNNVERPVIVIERKTWADLASSIVDGRADSQHERMLRFRANTGALIYYIIEGAVFQHSGREFARNNLTFKSLVKRLDHIADSGQVIIKHSRDHEDTARRIIELVRNYSDNSHPPHPITDEPVNIIGGAAPTTFRQQETSINKYWRSLAGVSVKIAGILSRQYTLADIFRMSATEENIQSVMECIKSGGGRCGPKIAARILAGDSLKFLTSIRGVSRQRAAAIIAAYPTCLADIANDTGDILANINNIGGVRKNTTIGGKIREAVMSV
jgi:ERCC4-type nuclease